MSWDLYTLFVSRPYNIRPRRRPSTFPGCTCVRRRTAMRLSSISRTLSSGLNRRSQERVERCSSQQGSTPPPSRTLSAEFLVRKSIPRGGRRHTRTTFCPFASHLFHQHICRCMSPSVGRLFVRMSLQDTRSWRLFRQGSSIQPRIDCTLRFGDNIPPCTRCRHRPRSLVIWCVCVCVCGGGGGGEGGCEGGGGWGDGGR